ncbi:MAG: hypothetical protein PWP03_273 [Candidatus Woesearchaeota archaeon]|nr:hypothetical protein [Candidatus Woesearchaeota archaeon]
MSLDTQIDEEYSEKKLSFGKSLLVTGLALAGLFSLSCVDNYIPVNNPTPSSTETTNNSTDTTSDSTDATNQSLNPELKIYNLETRKEENYVLTQTKVSFDVEIKDATQAYIAFYGNGKKWPYIDETLFAEEGSTTISKHYFLDLAAITMYYTVWPYHFEIKVSIPSQDNPATILTFATDLRAETPVFCRHNPELVDKLETFKNEILDNGTLTNFIVTCYWDADETYPGKFLDMTSNRDIKANTNYFVVASNRGIGMLFDEDQSQPPDATQIYYERGEIYVPFFDDFPTAVDWESLLDIAGIPYQVTEKGLLLPSAQMMAEQFSEETSIYRGIETLIKRYAYGTFHLEKRLVYYDTYYIYKDNPKIVYMLHDDDPRVDSSFAFSKETGNIMAIFINVPDGYKEMSSPLYSDLYLDIIGLRFPRGPPSKQLGFIPGGEYIKIPASSLIFFRVGELPEEEKNKVINALDGFEEHINELFGE